MNCTFRGVITVLSLAFGLFIPAFATAAMYTTYQAKIIKPDGNPLEATSVNFRFTILDPAGTCVLYTENFNTINMSGAAGLVSFSLGSGIKTYPTSGTLGFSDVFDNQVSSFTCASGGPASYTPIANDLRKIVMQFHDGTGWQTLPAMNINHVPYAMYANQSASATTAANSLQLNGKSDLDFVQVTAIPTCSASQALQFNGASFGCVAVGSSGGSTVVSVSGTAPIMVSGSASAPVISISVASASTDGYLTAADYTAFQSKLSASSTQIISTLGYTPANSATMSTLSNTVTSLTASTAASFAAITSSQWITSGTAINYAAGNVGVGTAAPNSKLEVMGTSYNDSYVMVSNNVSSTYVGYFGVQDTSGGGNGPSIFVGSYSGHSLSLRTNQIDRVVIDPIGNVALNPNNIISSKASLGTEAGELELYNSTTHDMTFRKITAGDFVFDGGNVGIGTTTPRASLDVSGNVTVGEVAANNALMTIYTQDSGSVSHGLALVDRAAGYGSWQNPSGLDGVSANSSGTITGWGQLYFNYYSSGNIDFNNGGGHSSFKGRVAVGMGSTPTARLHIAAGTSSTAPLKFMTGILLASPQPGAIEYDGTNYYFTDSTGTRKSINSIAASATPVAGSSGKVQYNNAGSLGANSSFSWNTTENSLNIGPANSFTGSGLAVANQFVLDLAAKDYKFVEWSGNLALASCMNASCGSYSMLASFDPVNGSFGVGTTPAAKLHVNGSAGAATLLLNNNALGSLVTNGVLMSADTTGFEINNQHSSAMTFKTASVERVRISTTGNVGIGTSAPSYKLDVASGDINLSNAQALRHQGVWTLGSDASLVSIGSQVTAKDVGLYSSGNSTPAIYANTSGKVGIGTNTPATALDVIGDIQYTGTITDVSDRRLKTNIEPLGSALTTIRKIKTYSYIMKDDPKARTEYGVMAQDMLGIIPALVKNIDTQGEYYGVNYMGLIPWSIRAIQEVDGETLKLRRENSEIKRELASLKEKNEVLEQKLEKILQALEQQKRHGEKK